MSLSRIGTSRTEFPSIKISPLLGTSNPAISRRSVVFPHPEGPRTVRHSLSLVATDTDPQWKYPYSIWQVFELKQ